MKPAPFHYVAPRSVDEALAVLEQYGEDAKVLAGGQSLIPAMNLRLARPRVLVDLRRAAGLDHLVDHGEDLEIGAMVTQRRLELWEPVGRNCPLLREALGYVGHVQTRRRGTIGGSLAHGDPVAELPAVMVALGAQCQILGPRAGRTVPAEEFIVSYYSTVLAPDEILTGVRVPAMAPGAGWCFLEFARTHGAFALEGVAAVIELVDGEMCARARIALMGGEPKARRLREAEAVLQGKALAPDVLDELRGLVQEAWESEGDLETPTWYRREVAGVLVRRAVRTAGERARIGIQTSPGVP